MGLTDALGRLAAALQLSEQEFDGWAVAEGLSATTLALPEGDLKELARRIAARTVLRRAHDLVGPIQPSRRVVRETLTEPFRGELDEETTLENLLGKEFPEPDDSGERSAGGAQDAGGADDGHVAFHVGEEPRAGGGGRRSPGILGQE